MRNSLKRLKSKLMDMIAVFIKCNDERGKKKKKLSRAFQGLINHEIVKIFSFYQVLDIFITIYFFYHMIFFSGNTTCEQIIEWF